ncbi:MAG: endonuclease/exonuclease/phosphatase family protein [Exiguobacterium profundum]|nr:MAG: endonuclease/exonuclease/phosphatase family protein [Exiguobacterium profundum]
MKTPVDLVVASWNIHKGVGTDRKRDLHRTAAVIAELGADIVALQEADTRFGTRTGLLDLDRLHRDTGLTPVPVRGGGPAHGWHGNVILARDAVLEGLREIDLPGLEPRGALMADFGIAGRSLRVVGAHLGLLRSSRRVQAEVLLREMTALDDRPTLLMGDLNEWREGWRSPFAGLSSHLPQQPVVRSFPARMPALALDRIMACNRGELSQLTVHDTPLARRASDHLPIRARLVLP